MLTSTEYFVFLCMLPVTIFIILPILIGAAWLVTLGLRNLTARHKQFVSESSKSDPELENGLQPSTV